MTRSHRGGGLSSQVVELDGRDALIHSSNDTLGDLWCRCVSPEPPFVGVDATDLDGLKMVHVQSIAELVDASSAVADGESVNRTNAVVTWRCHSHLVEGYKLSASI